MKKLNWKTKIAIKKAKKRIEKGDFISEKEAEERLTKLTLI